MTPAYRGPGRREGSLGPSWGRVFHSASTACGRVGEGVEPQDCVDWRGGASGVEGALGESTHSFVCWGGEVPTQRQRVPHEMQTGRYIGGMDTVTLHERLSSVASGKTYKAIGDLTDTHPETVRRYLQGQSPSVEFLGALCAALGVNADWLLTGRGPVKIEEVRTHALRQANPGELHAAMASTISVLVERVDRLETYCQTLETLVRVKKPGGDGSNAIGSGTDERAEPLEVRTRARRIADALAERPREDVD